MLLHHFEGFGEPLERRGSIPSAFQAKLAPLGWSLIDLRLKLQTDGNSCGVWLQVVRDAWLRYVDSSSFGSKGFKSFLEQEMAAEGVQNLYKSKGATRTAAGAKSRQFIIGQRADMRGRLVQAALDRKLRHEAASLAGFAPSLAQDYTLDDLDDEPMED